MNIESAIKRRRSIRKFKEKKIPFSILKEVVNAGRLAPSSMNRQPLEFVVVYEPKLEKKIFENSSWAGSVGWNPSFSERPKAYIIILANKEIRESSFKYDVGLAAENMCLLALEKDLGTCIIASIADKDLRSILNVPESREICLSIALGYSDQSPVKENTSETTKYWRDEKGIFHVPKRKLTNVLHRNSFD